MNKTLAIKARNSNFLERVKVQERKYMNKMMATKLSLLVHKNYQNIKFTEQSLLVGNEGTIIPDHNNFLYKAVRPKRNYVNAIFKARSGSVWSEQQLICLTKLFCKSKKELQEIRTNQQITKEWVLENKIKTKELFNRFVIHLKKFPLIYFDNQYTILEETVKNLKSKNILFMI